MDARETGSVTGMGRIRDVSGRYKFSAIAVHDSGIGVHNLVPILLPDGLA
jgi:hypothetical protein